MKNLMRWSLIPAAAMLLSACDAVIVESYPNIPANYNEGDFNIATPKGSIATIVVGDPFAMQSTQSGAGKFEDGVRALMKNQVGAFPIDFVPRHGAGTTKPYKVVVVFNSRQGVDNRTICRMEKQTPLTAAGSGQVSVTMVFCDGDIAKSGTRGRVGGVKDQNDPKFISLVRQVANAMIPPAGLQRQLQNSNDS